MRAIKHDRGSLRIIACPGSGKTETVSRRAAELVRNGARPSGIVAFTFTVKAADELKSRILGQLEQDRRDVGGMFIGTIDSFCLHMLKKVRPEYRGFEVLNEAKRMAFVSKYYWDIGINRLGKGRRTTQKFCESVDLMIMERIDPDLLSDDKFAQCYAGYLQKLEEEKFFDFVSVIRALLDVLGKNTDALKQVCDEIDHVIFDEYQDVNLLQEELLAFISKGASSICVVGDDDQNIFQWRGSDNKHILEFAERYGNTTTEILDVNYRATDALVRTAAKFISNNDDRKEKAMKAHDDQHNKFESGDMFHRHFETDVEEFRFICDTMQDLLGTEFSDRIGSKRPLSYGDMAVIVRTNEDAARITGAMVERGIPCVADSGTDVFKRPIVSLALDCIMYAFDHPGYDTRDVPDPEHLAERYSEEVPGEGDRFKVGLEQAREIARSISSGSRDWLPDLGLQEFYQRILSAMGAERGVLDDEGMRNLAVLSMAIADYEYVHKFLRAGDVAGLKWFIKNFAARLYPDPQHAGRNERGAVRVMTIWKAKGLEFPAVFIPSFHDSHNSGSDTFVDPHLYPNERYAGGEEAERRAYYTAITRAQKYLFLTSARITTYSSTGKKAKRGKNPHRFLDAMRNSEFSDVRTNRPKIAGNAENGQVGPVSATYSDLSVYERCPQDYYLRHVLGFDEGIPAAFGYGTAIHNIINRIHSDYIRNKKVPDDYGIEEIFDEMFHLRFAPNKHAENLKQAGLKTVKEYVRRYGHDFGRILETEKRFEFRLDDAMISGSIDLLRREEDGVEIVDFKTGSGSNEKYDLNHAEQARFYAYAARESLGHSPRKAVVHHLDTQTIEKVDTGEEDLRAAEKGITDKTRSIAAGRFDAEPEESKCMGCDYRALCPHKGFEVGVDFKPVRSRRRTNTADPAPQLSLAMAQRAQKLATDGVMPSSNGSYSVRSMSDPEKRYVVTEGRCECMGFRYSRSGGSGTPTCTHVEAVRIFLENGRK